MRAYLEIAKKSFQNNMVYRLDYLIGVVNTVIMIFVYIAIWKAIYGKTAAINGITLDMVATNFILGLAISNAVKFDESTISKRVQDGTIAAELLKPISYNLYFLFYNLGNIGFSLLMQFLPALVLAVFFIGILPPHGWLAMIFFVVSIGLGMLILYNLSYVISLSSFWVYSIWSFSTIKTVIVSILSGLLMPLWFMPDWLVNLIHWTPFDSIYFVPISIYLGRISPAEVWLNLIKQLLWVIGLSVVSGLVWKSAIKKLVVQGG